MDTFSEIYLPLTFDDIGHDDIICMEVTKPCIIHDSIIYSGIQSLILLKTLMKNFWMTNNESILYNNKTYLLSMTRKHLLPALHNGYIVSRMWLDNLKFKFWISRPSESIVFTCLWSYWLLYHVYVWRVPIRKSFKLENLPN